MDALCRLRGFLVLSAARYGYDWWSVGRFIESTDDAYAGGNVTPISPHVAGFVAQILAADNEYVRAGQPLIRLDDRDFRAAVDRATAIVAARQATLASLEARALLQQTTIRQAKADLDGKMAQAAFAKEDDLRYRELALSSSGSRQNAERASALDEAAQAGVVSSAAGLDAAKQQLTVLDADIAEARGRRRPGPGGSPHRRAQSRLHRNPLAHRRLRRQSRRRGRRVCLRRRLSHHDHPGA